MIRVWITWGVEGTKQPFTASTASAGERRVPIAQPIIGEKRAKKNRKEQPALLCGVLSYVCHPKPIKRWRKKTIHQNWRERRWGIGWGGAGSLGGGSSTPAFRIKRFTLFFEQRIPMPMVNSGRESGVPVCLTAILYRYL